MSSNAQSTIFMWVVFIKEWEKKNLHHSCFSGQRLPHDFQHIAPSFLVDGARSRLPGYASAGLPHHPRRPPRHHRVRVPPRLPVHRGVEFRHSDPFGCKCLPTGEPKTETNTQLNFNEFLAFHQLFGFVYACYVSKVFQDDEDSCKCLFFPPFQKAY